MIKKVIIFFFFIHQLKNVNAQFLMDMVDTSKNLGKGMMQLYNKYNNIKISGYAQFQYQIASEKGAKSFEGGDFATFVNNRFMIRRGRIRVDYIKTNKKDQPYLQLAMQLDGTEKGFGIRDYWARIFENKWQQFYFTTGMFARPFGYEVNLGSSDRESPERSRMSQILMKGERDLGAIVSWEPRKKNNFLKQLKLDAGLFNGQGIPGTNGDYDSYKDFISRLYIKPIAVKKNLNISGGLSLLNGGFIQTTKYKNAMGFNALNEPSFVVDSSTNNLYAKAPRQYYGADVQFKWIHNKMVTELRVEYWKGKQTALANTSETPAILTIEPYYTRQFNGAMFYFIQNIINEKHQLVFKYDWFDPNTKVSKLDIGKAGTNINATNIKYQTYGIGYIYYMNANVKLVFYYDNIINEKTQLPGFTSDVKDNVLTCRLQVRF